MSLEKFLNEVRRGITDHDRTEKEKMLRIIVLFSQNIKNECFCANDYTCTLCKARSEADKIAGGL